jgi:hypothetical protein
MSATASGSASGPTRRDRLRREVRRISRGVGNRLLVAGRVRPEGYDPAKPLHTDVAVFFPDGPEKLYQLTQWLPVLDVLNHRLTVTVVVRHAASFDVVRARTRLPVLLAPTYEDLMALYERAHYRAVIYVNHGLANFQSLALQPGAHVHVTHGESDKLCLVSNQAKAYDRVLVAGEAAVERHQAALAWFDTGRLLPVGRPQLDVLPTPALPPYDGRTVLYAPTWEGEDEPNNYTSVDVYGARVAEAALALPRVRFLYKPHPRVADSLDPGVRAGHRSVVEAIERAGGPHQVLVGRDVLEVLQVADLLVTDVSSVALDFLYLRPDKPLVVSDRRNDRTALLAESPMVRAAHVLDASTVGDLEADLARLLEHDPMASERPAVRSHYFGDRPPGQSLERFVAAVEEIIEEHEKALSTLTRRRGGLSGYAAG